MCFSKGDVFSLYHWIHHQFFHQHLGEYVLVHMETRPHHG